MATRRAWRATASAALILALLATTSAKSQNLPGWGYAQRFMGDITRQQRQEQQQQAQAARQQQLVQQQAAAREHTPHPVSASYSGNLIPISDLNRVLAGHTLYWAAPIVADGQLVRMNEMPVYYSASGQSFSPFWAAKPWVIEGNAFCVGGTSSDFCVRVFQDSNNQIFGLSPQDLLQHLSKVENGDTQKFQAVYARNQPAQRGGQQTSTAPNSEYAASTGLAKMLFDQIGKNPSYCYDFLGRYRGNKPGKWDDCDPTRQ